MSRRANFAAGFVAWFSPTRIPAWARCGAPKWPWRQVPPPLGVRTAAWLAMRAQAGLALPCGLSVSSSCVFAQRAPGACGGPLDEFRALPRGSGWPAVSM